MCVYLCVYKVSPYKYAIASMRSHRPDPLDPRQTLWRATDIQRSLAPWLTPIGTPIHRIPTKEVGTTMPKGMTPAQQAKGATKRPQPETQNHQHSGQPSKNNRAKPSHTSPSNQHHSTSDTTHPSERP
ncbi:hypothetical protein AMECASPLE_037928 [Ameca splendens]|uniref:Uncharacterized protein n=1 Tax=Ameca splendens TaxID=208324 RepID=A0ABV1A4E4_9TELE